MPNIENFVTYSAWQFDLIRHMFTLTVAVFAAGLVYFILSARNYAPKYRGVGYLSAVVMVSATYEIFSLWLALERSFVYESGRWIAAEGEIFSNGYRYANWCIDVPMLLTALLVALGISGKKFWTNWSLFTAAGILMILTGYVGQFYEPAAAGIREGSGAPFWIWGAISTVFFVYIVWQVMMLTHRTPEMSDRAKRGFSAVGWLLLISWTLYPFAYGLAAWWPTGEGVVLRQGLYTAADISSKLLYGIMLGKLAMLRSAEEGYQPAVEAGNYDHLPPVEKPAEQALR